MSDLKPAINVGLLLEKSAASYADHEAICFFEDGISLTYQQLNQAVNRYANVLRNNGIKQGDHVALMLPNCPDFPLTWLALSKLGAVTVALNIAYKANDLEYVLTNSDTCALVIHGDHLAVYKEVADKIPGIKKVYLSGESSAEGMDLISLTAETLSDRLEMEEIAPDALMNIQYTSGTTGFPKGCMLSHEYWLNFGKSAGDQMNITSTDRFLGVAPFYYVDSQWEMIMCIMSGATLVVGKKYSASQFMKWIHDYDITMAFATMAAWTFKQPESPLDKQHKLKCMMIGQFPAKLHKAFEERYNTPLRVGYGLTEAGPVTVVPPEERHMTEAGSVGKLDVLREARIIDESGNDVAPGEVGELIIRGPGMLQGYYKNPRATAETIKEGWFYTGDLFRTDANGHYYISGRKKDMIRRSGENIAANEGEDTLKSHPKIENAAVVAVPDESRFEEVKAYIVPVPGESQETIPPEEIIEFCRSKIAEFKVPRYIEYRESFTLTSVGKVIKTDLKGDKEALVANAYDRVVSKGK